MAKCSTANGYFHEKYFSKNVFSPLFLQIVHTQSTFLQPATSLWWSRRGHIYTHKKKLRILLARKKILSKYTEQKKINLKKEKSRPSEKCFIPFQWSEASKKEKKELKKSYCCCRQKTWKKNPYTKMEYYDEQNINCAWRDTLYLLHSWSFWFEDSIIIHATKCFWSHATSRGLFKNSSFAPHLQTVDLSALLNTDAYKKMCVFEKKL